MFSWLHNFLPSSILISFGPITIYWYGLFFVLGIISALFLILKLAKIFKVDSEKIWDLGFYLVFFGLIGARIYEIFLEAPYYFSHPEQIIKVWEGGLAIHGGIIAGLITLIWFVKKNNLEFWKMAAIITPGLALGQAIGRFGNWFNQELFGKPTNLPWGIPIEIGFRPLQYINNNFFHPTFIYESLGLIFITILLVYILLKKKGEIKKAFFIKITAVYLGLSAALRFLLEFIKADEAPTILGWRWPQLFTLFIILIAIIIYKKSKNV
jgi:phosphatidylglycerol:prolipoprotein diacylglycerol transferase